MQNRRQFSKKKNNISTENRTTLSSYSACVAWAGYILKSFRMAYLFSNVLASVRAPVSLHFWVPSKFSGGLKKGQTLKQHDIFSQSLHANKDPVVY